MEVIQRPSEFEEHLRRDNFMTYFEWAEIKTLENPEEKEFCYRCNHPLEPLCWYEPKFFTLPCWNCLEKRRSEREVMTENIIRGIRDFYMSRVMGDRYLQLFIIDPVYFSSTLPHTYLEFKKVINLLSPPSRNDIWFLDWLPGFPKIISKENLAGIKIVNLSSRYPDLDLGKTKIRVGDYEIDFPEETKLDITHKTRYSIFSESRKSKRIRVGDRCFKLYNTDSDKTKSIFKVTKAGEEVAFRSLPYQDYVILKLALMRDRSFLKFIFDILSDLSKRVNTLRDAVFLKNTVLIDPKKTGKLNFIWNPISDEALPEDEYFNLSLF